MMDLNLDNQPEAFNHHLTMIYFFVCGFPELEKKKFPGPCHVHDVHGIFCLRLFVAYLEKFFLPS